jgi:fatty acid desaturase
LTEHSIRAGWAVEWPTVAVAAACYGVWLAAGIWLYQAYPFAALFVLALCCALHSSLVHECLHGHPTRKAALNEALVFLPLGLIWPYRRFKTLHMKHHADERLTDPFDDPESYYHSLWHMETLPDWFQAVLRVNNTLAGRMVLNPLLSSIGLILLDVRAIRAGDKSVLDAWLRHLAGAAVVLAVVVIGFGIPLWLYLLVPCWLGQSIIAIRTYAEHQWHETPEGRTIIVERSPLAFFFLNNNLHLVHHKHPTAAWYRLPALFKARRAEWIAMNGGYVFGSYWALARSYLFKPKEPNVHPALHREKVSQ